MNINIDLKDYTKKEFVGFLEDTDYCANLVEYDNPCNHIICPADIGLKEVATKKAGSCQQEAAFCKTCWLEAIKDVEFKEESIEGVIELNKDKEEDKAILEHMGSDYVYTKLYKASCCNSTLWISDGDDFKYCPYCSKPIEIKK
jgi:hypothetical protein